MRICLQANIHVCPQCSCAAYCSAKKLQHYHREKHLDTRTVTNLTLCPKHTHGTLLPNHNPIWDKALQFFDNNISPDPANFRSGVHGKVNATLRSPFDDIFMGLIYAFIDTSQHYVGTETSAWNSHTYVFLWLLFQVEMLMGPHNEKSDNKSETTNECVGRQINLFPVWAH